MIRLDTYLKDKKIIAVDFLKTDIEEYDYFALIGCGEFLDKCKFVQFELGLGAPIGDKYISYDHYYELFSKNFSLYILKDENNPLWVKALVDCDLIILDDLAKTVIRNADKTGVGFNIVAVNKKYKINLGGLHIGNLDQSHLKENIFVYDLN